MSQWARIDPIEVPEPFSPLIPYAEKWGISDDERLWDVVEQASVDELRELVKVVSEFDAEGFDEWLGNTNVSNRAWIAFVRLVDACDLAKSKLQLDTDGPLTDKQSLHLEELITLLSNITSFTLRPARESESAQIKGLIHLVGINPMGLDWKRFIVAVNDRDEMIGCGQLKPHGEDILELASLAVYPEHRGKGVARAIIEYLLKNSPRPLYLMCESSNGPLYEKFGFQVLNYEEMPRYFQRISKLAGLVTTLAQRDQSLWIMKLQ